MMPSNATIDPVCRETQSLLSDYLDNTLSARSVWEVEKHLATCAECTEYAQTLQQTVDLLHNAERFDTSDDFMSKLHARLDGLEPEPMRRTNPFAGLRDWLAGVRDGLYARRVPALSLGMATLAMALILIVNRPMTPGPEQDTSQPSSIVVSQDSGDTLSRHVAMTASNPFDDPVAAKLEAEAPNETVGKAVN